MIPTPPTYTPPPPSTTTTTTTSQFPFPRDYHFPPFFSRQDNASTYHAQRSKWGQLILSYCRFHKLWKLSLVDALDTELFYNKKLDKRLSLADAREMVEFLRRESRAEWIGKDGDRSTAWIWWKNPEEWATLIADWVDETGQKNTVLTLYELTESEATVSQEFHGMDAEVLQKALNVLVKRGKAQVFGQEDGQGAKFF